MISLSFSRIYYGSAIFFANPLSISRIHYESTIFFTNSLSIWQIHYELTWWKKNTLDVSRIHYEFSWCFAYIRWIHYLLREFSLNSLSISWIPLWIRLVFRKFNSFFATINSLWCVANSPCQITVSLTKSLSFCLIIALSLLFFSRIHYES